MIFVGLRRVFGEQNLEVITQKVDAKLVQSLYRVEMDSRKYSRSLGAKIRQIRRERGLSQSELAKRAEINRSYLSMVENGKSSPTIDVAERLAHGLGVSTGDLLWDESTKHFTYDSEDSIEIFDGLQELLNSESDVLLINPSIEELELLKSIRFSGKFNPPKQFFIDTLLHYRRHKK